MASVSQFMGRHWRVSLTAGVLLVLSNGPVLRFVHFVSEGRGIWSDLYIWPFFAAASSVLAALAWQTWRPGRIRPHAEPKALSCPAVAAIACYSAATVLSSLWSVDASATSWRSVVYAGLALGAVALAGYSESELADTLALFAATAVFASLVLLILRSDDGLDHNGDWIGVYTNRNSLAPVAAIGVIAGLCRVVEFARGGNGSIHRLAGGVALCTISLLTMVGAGSRTAWIALLASLGAASVLAGAALATSRRARIGWATAAIAGALLSVSAIAMLWDTSTLAQRRALWSIVWERVQERPWGGYGFFVFWELPEMVTGNDLLQRGSAHNSLLETALGLGLLGTVPLLVLVVLAAVNSARCLWRHPSALSWMWAAVTVVVLIENATESFVLWFSYNWVLLVAAALRVPGGPRFEPAVGEKGQSKVSECGEPG